MRALSGEQFYRCVAEELAKEHGPEVTDEFVTEVGKAIRQGFVVTVGPGACASLYMKNTPRKNLHQIAQKFKEKQLSAKSQEEVSDA